MYSKTLLFSSLTTFKVGLVAAMAAFFLVATPASALMMKPMPQAKMSTSVVDMTATVDFTLGSPCSPYTLDWGDGEKISQEPQEDVMCIQVLQDMSLEHTYEDEGTYTILLTHSGMTNSRKVDVPATVVNFDLDDVQTVTSLWVDPNEMMADEEYTIYTITLKDDTVVEVNAGGFTTQEWREQQFVDAGYTGDIDALIAMAEPVEEEEEEGESVPAPEKETEYKNLQTKIVELLNKLIALLRG
jgi:hypothetical protein